MKTLGIRAKPTEVTFIVYDSAQSEIINNEIIKIPNALSIPEGLKYLRNHILDILREYGIERAGIRITESNSDNKNIRRIQIEGVIQEAFASSNLKAYYCGQISSISPRVGIEREQFKTYVDGEKEFAQVENWSSLKKEAKEATLAALGAVND